MTLGLPFSLGKVCVDFSLCGEICTVHFLLDYKMNHVSKTTQLFWQRRKAARENAQQYCTRCSSIERPITGEAIG
jgi:hypothetical protein